MFIYNTVELFYSTYTMTVA